MAMKYFKRNIYKEIRVMSLPTSNLLLKINKVKFLGFFGWIIAGIQTFRQSPLKYLLISAIFMLIFLMVFIISSQFQGEFVFSLIITSILSLMFPLGLASLCIASREYQQNQVIHIKRVFADLFAGPSIRLTIVYVLILLLISIASSYILLKMPTMQVAFSYLLEVAYVLLQMIILVAIPMNILVDDRMPPFQVLGISTKALLTNFVPCLIFIFCVFAILIVAIILAKAFSLLVGAAAIFIYLVELWLFIIWLSLSSVAMVKSIFVI